MLGEKENANKRKTMNKKITKATITYPWHLLLVLLYFFGSREQDICAAHMAFSDKP